MKREVLEKIFYKAWKTADSSIYDTGSNYWVGIFLDQLEEELKLQYYNIPKNIKSFEDMLNFINENDKDE